MPENARRRSRASPALRFAARWCSRESESVPRAKRPASEGAAWARRKMRTEKWRFMSVRILAVRVVYGEGVRARRKREEGGEGEKTCTQAQPGVE